MKKLYTILFAVCILSFVGHLFVYPMLPETVPTHWGISGEVDAYSAKESTLFLALLPLLMLVLFRFIPKLDPRGKNYEKHQKAYDMFLLILVLFMTALVWATNAFCLGYPVKINMVVPVGVGILFLVIGNYMPQLRSNYTMGIKTPWTIENEWVWKKTHAMGGIVFCILGVLLIIAGILQKAWAMTGVFVLLLAGTLWLFLYSYLMYRKWLRQGGDA